MWPSSWMETEGGVLNIKIQETQAIEQGLYAVESVIDECLKINIKYLTLYTFSTENWKRPKKEINYLFNLLENFLTNKIDNLLKKKY